MERVENADKCYFVDSFGNVSCILSSNYLYDKLISANNCFNSEEEAEAMAKKLRAVLKGADVIEMPSEEELEKKMPEFFNPKNEEERVGWIKCYHWLKSKIVE